MFKIFNKEKGLFDQVKLKISLKYPLKSFILFARKEIDARTQLSTTLEKNVIKTIQKTKTAIKERNEKFIKDHNIQQARRFKAEEKLEFYFNEYKKTHDALVKFDKNNKKGSK